MRVPREFTGREEAAVVFSFDCPASGELQAVRKLSDLPIRKPSVQGLLRTAATLAGQDELGALHAYECAHRIHPCEPAVLIALARFRLDARDERLRDAKQAVSLAREAVRLTHAQNAACLDTLARALHANGTLIEAAAYARQAADQNPYDEDAAARAQAFAKELGNRK
ncbi:MAG: hypothetical protein NTW87_15465 [Planctomycetota bacterium]|nr:hypothetical protein [Planctomycetota bacterium]